MGRKEEGASQSYPPVGYPEKDDSSNGRDISRVSIGRQAVLRRLPASSSSRPLPSSPSLSHSPLSTSSFLLSSSIPSSSSSSTAKRRARVHRLSGDRRLPGRIHLGEDRDRGNEKRQGRGRRERCHVGIDEFAVLPVRFLAFSSLARTTDADRNRNRAADRLNGEQFSGRNRVDGFIAR